MMDSVWLALSVGNVSSLTLLSTTVSVVCAGSGSTLISFLIFKDKDNVTLLESKYFYPLTYQEVERWQNTGNINKNKIKDSYGIHLFEGSWWKNGMALAIPSRLRLGST